MNGSCLEAKPVQVPSADEPMTFSYFSDVSAHINVLEQALVVQETIKGGIAALVKHANYWKKYRALWKMQRVCSHVNEFLQGWRNNVKCMTALKAIYGYNNNAPFLVTSEVSPKLTQSLTHPYHVGT